MKQKDRIIVSAVLVSKNRKILLGKVRIGGVYPDCWHIPGGGVDENETKNQALIREMKEEVGINVKNCPIKLLSNSLTGECVKTDNITGEKCLMKMKFNIYLINLDKDSSEINISLNDDLREYKWVTKDELIKYKHTPPSEKLFKFLGWI